MARLWPCVLRRPHDLISVPAVAALPSSSQPGFLHGDPRPYLPNTLAKLAAAGAAPLLPYTPGCDLLLSPAPQPGHETETLLTRLRTLPARRMVALYERDRPVWPNLLVHCAQAVRTVAPATDGLRAYRSGFLHQGRGEAEALLVLPAARLARLLRGHWLAAVGGRGPLAHRRFLQTALDHERTLAVQARRPGAAQFPAARRLLVVMPHFDDEVLQCGGAILQARERGAEVRLVWLTDGARGIVDVAPEESARRRQEEGRAAAQLLGVDDLHFLDAPETRLAAQGPWTTRLRALFEEFQPDAVVGTWWMDNHVDHYEANRVLRAAWPRALAQVPLAAAGVWAPLAAGATLPLTPAQAARREQALRCHASQLEAVDYARAGAGLAAWYAADSGAGAAERYWVLAADEYFAAFRESGADRRRWR